MAAPSMYHCAVLFVHSCDRSILNSVERGDENRNKLKEINQHL